MSKKELKKSLMLWKKNLKGIIQGLDKAPEHSAMYDMLSAKKAAYEDVIRTIERQLGDKNEK
ncbi:MAG TPA: hypothetical protein VMV86_02015 [Methanosarcinales archaeon]|nr:hypothetical protein [Methanosarcinales archaeon]